MGDGWSGLFYGIEWSSWLLYGPRQWELSLGSLWQTYRGMMGGLFYCLDSFIFPFIAPVCVSFLL